MAEVVASTQRDARNAWASDYPFESQNNGLGISLACTTTSGTSSRTALVGSGTVMMFTNVSTDTAYVAWGYSSITATTSYYPILPGTKEVVTISGDSTITHVAGITSSWTATILVHRGYGN